MSDNTPQPVQLVALREQFQLEHVVEHYGGHYWRPNLRRGEVRVGYVCTKSAEAPTKDDLKGLSAAPIVVSINNDLVGENILFRKPDTWTRLWPKSPRNGDRCIYRPSTNSNDYVALSDVAVAYSDAIAKGGAPDKDFRCVHKALVSNSEFIANPIWADEDSTWNIEGTAFFMRSDTEAPPWSQDGDAPTGGTVRNYLKKDSVKVKTRKGATPIPPTRRDGDPYALTGGTVFSHLKKGSVRMTTPDTIEWEPVVFCEGYYKNTNDQKYTETFIGIMTTSTSVTGTWQREDSLAIGNKFNVGVELAVEVTVGPVKYTEKESLGWELAVTKTATTSIGGGTTNVSTATFQQNCVVEVQPGKTTVVQAFFYKGKYDLEYTGVLQLVSETKGAPPIEIPIKGTFGVNIDTLKTWWEVSDGTFVSKTTPEPKK
jgi:hypothetical protein